VSRGSLQRGPVPAFGRLKRGKTGVFSRPFRLRASRRLHSECSGGTLLAGLKAIMEIPAEKCCYVWIDEATGKRVKTRSASPDPASHGQVTPDYGEPDHAHDPYTGASYVTTDGGETWINTQTGQAVNTRPESPDTESFGQVTPDYLEPDHAHDPYTGRNFVRIRVPCPPRTAPAPTPSGQGTGKSVVTPLHKGLLKRRQK
jgi:hypothetical protein